MIFIFYFICITKFTETLLVGILRYLPCSIFSVRQLTWNCVSSLLYVGLLTWFGYSSILNSELINVERKYNLGELVNLCFQNNEYLFFKLVTYWVMWWRVSISRLFIWEVWSNDFNIFITLE